MEEIMPDRMPITIGDHALNDFLAFCTSREFKKLLVIADENTYGVLGRRVADAAEAAGLDVITCVLDPDGLHTDGVSILRVLNAYDAQPRLFVAVGSGTITDITRFASHRSQNPFVSFPTAASVDAYTSKNAPVTVGNLKGSIYCQAPLAIFTDIQTVAGSPKFLTASGFGDLVSKATASTDWKISHIVWGVQFDDEIYAKAVHAGLSVMRVVDGIRTAEPEAMEAMMKGQFESGFCMADFGNSAPASGAEHHIAHIWEMMFHWEHKEGLYHGHAVGVAAIICAEWYRRLKALSRADAAALLEKTSIPERVAQMHALQSALPQIADELIAENPIYLQLADAEKWAETKNRILDNWDAIQDAAQNVPDPESLREWIRSLGGPVTPAELGVSAEQVRLAKENGHYLRERFSINILRKLFGWD
jgi:glycerol-1-phosphate dehydrogenase [NAD(P)+]